MDWKHEIQLQPIQFANKQQTDRNLSCTQKAGKASKAEVVGSGIVFYVMHATIQSQHGAEHLSSDNTK